MSVMLSNNLVEAVTCHPIVSFRRRIFQHGLICYHEFPFEPFTLSHFRNKDSLAGVKGEPDVLVEQQTYRELIRGCNSHGFSAYYFYRR